MRYYIEYLGTRLGLLLVDSLSFSAAGSLSLRIANAWFSLNKSRRVTAMENIARSGIAKNNDEARKIAKESFRHFGLLIIESLKSNELINETNWREHVRMEVPDETMEILKDPDQGVILVSGHLGNWEVAAQLLSYIKPVMGITKNMNNPYTDKLMKERKPRNNFRLTPKRDVDTSRFLECLKNGEILALLADQYGMRRGMMVDFFGTPASTHKSPALLHLVTKAPICFGYCVRTGDNSYMFKADKPLIHKPTGNKNEDIRAILETINASLEKAIRENPTQYLWAHRRWRHLGENG